MLPQRTTSEIFRNNIDAMFGDIDRNNDQLSLYLNQSIDKTFACNFIKTDKFGHQTSKKVKSRVLKNEGIDVLEFKFTEDVSPIVFALKQNMIYFTYLDDRVSYFESTVPILIDNLSLQKDLHLKAPGFKVINALTSRGNLILYGNAMDNSGVIFSPSLCINIDTICNKGGIISKSMSMHADRISFFGNSYSVADDVHLHAADSINLDKTSIQCHHMGINSPHWTTTNGSIVRITNTLNVWSNSFANYNSELSFDEGLLFTSSFANTGHIQSNNFCLDIRGQQLLYGGTLKRKDLVVYDFFSLPDTDLGTFTNSGDILSKRLMVSLEKNMVNRGNISIDQGIDIANKSDLINEGVILQNKYDHEPSMIRSRRIHNSGRLEFAHDLIIKGQEIDNKKGVIKAKNIDIELSLSKNLKFKKNEKEKLSSQVESNETSSDYAEYMKIQKTFKRSDKSKPDTEQTNPKSETKTTPPNFGFIDNNGGRIESAEKLKIKGSGPIFNGDQGKITAKANIEINILGRFINQFKGQLSSPNIFLHSRGRIFNMLGATIDGNDIRIESNGLINGIGSKVSGGIKLISKGDITNDGEMLLLLSELNADEKIYNHGIMFCNDDLICSSERFDNFGTIVANGKIDLHKVHEVCNTAGSLLESKGSDIIFPIGIRLLNEGRISSANVELKDFVIQSTDSGHKGIWDTKNLFKMSTDYTPSDLNSVIKADKFDYTCKVVPAKGYTICFDEQMQHFSPNICASEVILSFPNVPIENRNDTVVDFVMRIKAKSFKNFALLKSTKSLYIESMDDLINGIDYLREIHVYRLLNDWDLSHRKEIAEAIYRIEKQIRTLKGLEGNKEFVIQMILSPQKRKNMAVISADNLSLQAKVFTNTGTILAKDAIIKASLVEHGYAYETKKKVSLPGLEFEYDFMKSQMCRLDVENRLDINGIAFINMMGQISSGEISANCSELFLNYGGDIYSNNKAKIVTKALINSIGSLKTNRQDRRFCSIEFYNTGQPCFNVHHGIMDVSAPYVLNNGGHMYAGGGVYFDGRKSALKDSSMIDISSAGFKYTRMFTVTEYNKNQYTDKILGLGLANTDLGAIIRADLNETVQKEVLPASLSSSKEVIIKRYNSLESTGIIHAPNIKIKTGIGLTELGYSGKATLPQRKDFSRNIEIYPYISSIALSEVFDLSDNNEDFFFRSRSNGMKLPIVIIGEPSDTQLKLPFSLEVLDVILLKQLQMNIGTGYLSDMPTMIEAAQKSYERIKGSLREAKDFPHLKNYTTNPIKITKFVGDAAGLFFKIHDLQGNKLLFPELHLSSESVHKALLNPSGATVAQGQENANVIIDTEGFLHATSHIHADDNVNIKAGRGALFETTTYDDWAITQNEVAARSRGFLGTGLGAKTKRYKLSEWHKIKRAREPMLATTTRGDFIVVLPRDEDTAEFKGMFADIAGNFEVYGGKSVLSPLELASVVPCPGIYSGGANRISTLLPVFLGTVIKSKHDFLADVRVFKNTGSKIEAIGDITINAKDKIEFNTQTRKFILTEGTKVDGGIFTAKTSSRKVEDVIFNQPEAKAGRNINLNSDDIYVTGKFTSGNDIKINARLAKLESVLGYGTDKFNSNASSMFAKASYSRFATCARIAPTVFKAHGDFIADIAGLYVEHSIQKHVTNEGIRAGRIDSSPLAVHEVVIEQASSKGLNLFAPTSVIAPVCDGKINEALGIFWKQSPFLNSANELIHSKKGAEIAANGISTALSAYDSLKTVLDYGMKGGASLFGIGGLGFYNTRSHSVTTHNFTVGSTTIAENNIEWYATTGDIKIAHRIAKAQGDQTYIAAGKILVDAGHDSTHAISKTISFGGNFNIFTMDLAAYASQGETHSEHVEYQPSLFKSCGDNVFRAGESVEIVIPQISGTRNVFDAVLVSLENKANEEEMHTTSYGATFSTNLVKTAAGTLGANIGASNSYDTFLNDAYIRGATDFMRSRVRNQGCLVMDIDNSGASYQYVPASEVHKSRNFAICLSGLDLSSPDAFAYSLGRSLASSATSAGIGMLASEAGLGGFVSSVASSLAGTYINTEVFPQSGGNKTGLGSNSHVSFKHSGDGFNAMGIEFDKNELNAIINKVKEKVFAEALDAGALTEEAVHKSKEAVEQFTQQVSVEKAKVDVTAERIDDAESVLRDEITSAISDDEAQKLAEGKSISNDSKAKVVKALSESIKKLERQKAELNLHAPINQDEVQQASLQTQNELINEKIQQYNLLSEFLSRAQSGITRSNSADDLLQDTYIRQGQRAFGTVTGAFSSLAHEADSMSQHDYVELQRSRLPAEARDNPEVLAKLGVGYTLYKGAAKLGQGISALDDATGNVVSGAMHKLEEGFEWLGTHTRRLVRDDLGLGQRIGQNVGDVAQIAAEIFAPGTVFKTTGSICKIVGATKFRSALGERFGLFKGEVSATKIGLKWGDPVLGEQGYGMAFENYIATLPEFKRFRLPKNFKTFDFWDRASGRAVSVKTLDTNAPSRLMHPESVYHTLKGYVDKTLDFTKYEKGLWPDNVSASKIKTREIQLGIPADTRSAQMQQIQRAIEYGKLNNVKIEITRIGK